MDKLEKAKCLLVTDFFSYLRKLEKGHPMNGYKPLKQGMLNINFITNYPVPKWQYEAVLDSILAGNYKPLN